MVLVERRDREGGKWDGEVPEWIQEAELFPLNTTLM